MHQRMEFTEVAATDKLVMLMSSADADWNVIPSPMMPNWPLILRTTVTFIDIPGGSTLGLTWEPFEASDAEVQSFATAIPDLDKGWGVGMDVIDEIVAELF